MTITPKFLRLFWVLLLLLTAFLTWSVRNTAVISHKSVPTEFVNAGCSLWLPQSIEWQQEKVFGGEILSQISLLINQQPIGEIQRWVIPDIHGFLAQSRDLAYGSFLEYRQRNIQQNDAEGIRLSYQQVSHDGHAVWGEELWLWSGNSPEKVRVVIRYLGSKRPTSEWVTQTTTVLDSVKLLPRDTSAKS